MRKFLLACLAAAACTGAHAELVVNGSFESGSETGTFITVGPNSAAITGWTVGKGSVDYIGGLWQAANGSRSIDLAGSSNPTTLFQDLATAAGSSYRVSFFMSGNPDGAPLPVKPMSVAVYDVIGGVSLIESNPFTFDTTGISFTNMRWTQYAFDFVAASTSTRLSFEFGPDASCCYGPALDQVSTVLAPASVPAPGTLLLLGAGLATIGAAGGRRRAKA